MDCCKYNEKKAQGTLVGGGRLHPGCPGEILHNSMALMWHPDAKQHALQLYKQVPCLGLRIAKLTHITWLTLIRCVLWGYNMIYPLVI